ncbi:MAG: DUF192 domain-containing protein [Polyangiales bacterium]
MKRAVAIALILSACTKAAPEATSVVSTATTTTATATTTATTTATGTTTTTATTATATVGSNDWSRDCPRDPDPSIGARLYDRGVARFLTPDGTAHELSVEIARSDAAHERGLMYRTSLADDFGMVFVFADPHHAVFWMKNTCVPLDMIFVGEDDKVIGVVTAPRLNVEPREVPGFSRYVVEVAAGRARALGIGLGTRFVPPPRS